MNGKIDSGILASDVPLINVVRLRFLISAYNKFSFVLEGSNATMNWLVLSTIVKLPQSLKSNYRGYKVIISEIIACSTLVFCILYGYFHSSSSKYAFS